MTPQEAAQALIYAGMAGSRLEGIQDKVNEYLDRVQALHNAGTTLWPATQDPLLLLLLLFQFLLILVNSWEVPKSYSSVSVRDELPDVSVFRLASGSHLVVACSFFIQFLWTFSYLFLIQCCCFTDSTLLNPNTKYLIHPVNNKLTHLLETNTKHQNLPEWDCVIMMRQHLIILS